MSDRSLRVAHVSLHSCIRAHKIAWTWSDENQHLNPKILFVAEPMINQHHPWWAHDAAIKLYRDDAGEYQPWQLENAVKTLDPIVDIWHIHNEPDWPVWIVRRHTDKPIVYDIHDLRSQRNGESEEQEDKAFEAANGYSCVSRRYQEIAIVRGGGIKPAREVLSAVPKGFYPKEKPKTFRGGIVYEGGLGEVGTAEFPCRSWSDVFREILDLGIQVWAYSGSPVHNPVNYKGVMLIAGTPYASLMHELSMYEFGLVGSPVPDPMFDGALPNKMFEYMAAGLPMICMNAPDVSAFLNATGMGVTVNDVKEIPDAMQYMRDHRYRRRVWDNRWNWAMETQVGKVTKLYEDLLGRSLQKPVIPGEFKRPDAP